MESFEFELPTTYIEVEDIWLPTGLGILEGVWGPGLPAGRIFEMHSDLGLDMTKVALQVAAGVVQRGLDVAFFDVNRVLTDHMISSTSRAKTRSAIRGWAGSTTSARGRSTKPLPSCTQLVLRTSDTT